MPNLTHTDMIYNQAKEAAQLRKLSAPKPGDPIGAFKGALKHSFGEIKQDVQRLGTGVSQTFGGSLDELEDPGSTEERIESAAAKTAGGLGGLIADVAFALPVAGFEALNEMSNDSEGGSVVGDMLLVANTGFAFLGELGDVPEDETEQKQRAQTFAGNWAGKIRDGFWEGLTGESVSSNMADTKWKYMTEDLLNNVLPDILVVKGTAGLPKAAAKTGAALKRIQAMATKSKRGVPDHIKNSNLSAAEKVQEYMKRDEPLLERDRAELLDRVEQIVRRDDVKALEAFERSNPEIVRQYAAIERSRFDFVEKFKEVLDKTKKGEEVTIGDKRHLVESFERQFERGAKSTSFEINDLLTRVRSSELKVDMYKDVMTEVVASTMSHPRFTEAVKFDRTRLRAKEPKSFEDKGRFAQLKGAEPDFTPPTADAARAKLEQRAMKEIQRELESGPTELFLNDQAKGLGKFKKVLPELDSMDLPSALKLAESKLAEKPNATLQEFVDRFKDFDSKVDEVFKGERGADDVFSDISLRSQEVRSGERHRDGRLRLEGEKLSKVEEKALKDIERAAETPEGKAEIQVKQPSPGKEIDKLVERIPEDAIPFEDNVVGKFFKEDSNPIGLYDEYIRQPREIVAEKIVDKALGEELMKTDREWQNEQGRVVNEMHDLQNQVLARFEGENKGILEKVTMRKRMELLADESRKIFEAIEEPKLREGLSPENKKIVQRFTDEFDAQRIVLKDHHMSMMEYRQRKIRDAQDRILDLEAWLEGNAEGANAAVVKRVKAQIKHHKDTIDLRNSRIKESENIIGRLAERNDQYVPHIIQPFMRTWVEKHFPEVVDAATKALLFRDNNFLKVRKNFPFYQKDAFSAMALYKREAKRQMMLERLAEDMIDSAAERGYIGGTVKGDFLRKFIDQKFFEKRPGRETVEPTAKVLYEGLYKAAGKVDEGVSALMKKDLEVVSDMFKREVILTKEQMDFIRKNARDLDKIEIDGDVLKLRLLEPNINSVDAGITNLKNLGYAGTIGLNIRTMMLNLITQPVAALSHTGMGALEGMKAAQEAYKFAFKSWQSGEGGRKFREQLENTGLAPSNRQLFNPERPFTLNRERFTSTMLVNMQFSEYVARTVAAHMGYQAFKKGKLSKKDIGEVIEIDGVKLAKGWSDKFNFEYTASTMPLWTDSMFGRSVMFLGSFGLKNLDLHGKLVKDAAFTQWLSKSEKIFRQKDIDTPVKMERIMKEYASNKSRIGLTREVAYGLAAAMVLGQIFDIDLNEFTTKGVGFGISNPITNLFLGTGGWNQDVTDKVKPFIPGRGAVRSIDKTLGTDVLSNYRKFGNVPQIEDLLKEE